MSRALILRNVEVAGRRGMDMRIEAGVIAAVGAGLPRSGADEIDGGGGAVIPGLCDHHIHLMGLAAQADTVILDGVADPAAFAARIRNACAARRPAAWVRVSGYHERIAGALTRRELDRLAPAHPVRLQHQTGALWILNSLALASLGAGEDDPPGLDRDTGHLFRGDAWLRTRIPSGPPALAPLGRRLSAFGITAVTDASVTTDTTAASLLARAHRTGVLPQRLTLMSGGALAPAIDGSFAVGPRKVLLDDGALPDIEEYVRMIGAARKAKRNVAVHCVTATQLALTLAAFDAAGSVCGDRIEHGSVIPEAALEGVKRAGLTVVTQPAFVGERGDRYLAEVDPADLGDLYRCETLRLAGIPVAGSSDAPYTNPDPWAAMRAAVSRLTPAGKALGARERITPAQALALYLDHPSAPGRRQRCMAPGEIADLCVLDAPLQSVLQDLSASHVAATLIAGAVVYAR